MRVWGGSQLWAYTVTHPTVCHHQRHHSDGKPGTFLQANVLHLKQSLFLWWKETPQLRGTL